MRFTMVNFVSFFYTIAKRFYLSKLLSVTSTIVKYKLQTVAYALSALFLTHEELSVVRNV